LLPNTFQVKNAPKSTATGASTFDPNPNKEANSAPQTHSHSIPLGVLIASASTRCSSSLY